DFAARAVDGPALDEVHQGKIDAGVGAEITEGHAHRFGDGFVVGAELGGGGNGAVEGVEDADAGGLRLGLDEIGDVADLDAEVDAVGIVNDDGEFEFAVIALRGNPGGDVELVFTGVNGDVALADGGSGGVFRAERGDDCGDRHSALRPRRHRGQK